MNAIAVRLIGDDLTYRDFTPLLKWMILAVVIIFGLFAAWSFELLQFMVRNDRSYITLVILALFGVFSLHCLYLIIGVSRQTNAGHRVQRQIDHGNRGFRVEGDEVLTSDGTRLHECKVTHHIRNLIVASDLQGGKHLDQTLLLRNLAESLRNRQSVGWFVADAMLKLGLLGTVIGFILMLQPISQLESFEVETLKSALTAMSGGMGVALFTTLFGLIGGLLLKLQYYILDDGTAYLFNLATELTEVYVVSVLNRGGDGTV